MSIDKRQETLYLQTVIQSFLHSGLEDFYHGRGARRVSPEHVRKLRRILSALDQINEPQEMNLVGFRFHQLSGRLQGYYSVSANWRVIFRFENGHVTDVDYLDYH